MNKEKEIKDRENLRTLKEVVGDTTIHLHSVDKKLLKFFTKVYIGSKRISDEKGFFKAWEVVYSEPKEELKNCVVGYIKNSLGSCFIIKGVRQYYAFVLYENLEQKNFSFGFNCSKIPISQALKTINMATSGEHFICNEHIDKLKTQEVLNNIIK